MLQRAGLLLFAPLLVNECGVMQRNTLSVPEAALWFYMLLTASHCGVMVGALGGRWWKLAESLLQLYLKKFDPASKLVGRFIVELKFTLGSESARLWLTQETKTITKGSIQKIDTE